MNTTIRCPRCCTLVEPTDQFCPLCRENLAIASARELDSTQPNSRSIGFGAIASNITSTTIHVQQATFVTQAEVNNNTKKEQNYSPDDERLLRAMRLSQKAEAFLRRRFSASGNGLGECLSSVHSQVRKLDQELARELVRFVPIRNILTHHEEHQIEGPKIDEVLRSLDQILQRHLSPTPPRSVPIRPSLITVCRSGLGDFAMLSAALSAANEGDTIFIMPGVYQEAVSIGKAISIIGRGEQPGDVLIATDGDVLDVETSSVRVENVTLRTTSAPESRAYAAHVLPGLEDVRFVRCHFQAKHGTGFIARANSHLQLSECRFEDSLLALRLEGCATVDRCVFFGNQTALLARRHAECIVESCSFEGHDVALELRDQVRTRIACNIFNGDRFCIVATDVVSGTVEGNCFNNCSEESRFVQIDGAAGLASLP